MEFRWTAVHRSKQGRHVVLEQPCLTDTSGRRAGSDDTEEDTCLTSDNWSGIALAVSVRAFLCVCLRGSLNRTRALDTASCPTVVRLRRLNEKQPSGNGAEK